MGLGQLALIRRADLWRGSARPEAAFRRAGRPANRLRARAPPAQKFVRGELTRAESYAFDSVDDGLRSLRAGRIDYFVHDAPDRLAGGAVPREEDELMGLFHPLTKEQLAWAVATATRR